MNKIIIGIIIVVLLAGGLYFMSILLAGGLYFMDRQPETPDIDIENNIKIIQDAYLGTGSVVCDLIDPGYEYMDDEEFTLYVRGGKMRISVKSGDDLSGDIIIKNDYYYFWTEEGGIKMALEQTKEKGFFVPFRVKDGEMIITNEQDLRFDCRSQVIGDAMFEVPSNIEFMGVDEFINNQKTFQDDFEWDPELLEGIGDLEDFDLPEIPEDIEDF